MGRSIWETVAANKVEAGDVISYFAKPGSDSVPDDSFRVRVTSVGERAGEEPLPYVVVRFKGPTDRFEPLAGITSNRLYRQGDPVRRMVRERAARVSDTNLRTVLKPSVPTSADRLAMAASGQYAPGVVPGDL
jgi:hypothetical protein